MKEVWKIIATIIAIIIMFSPLIIVFVMSLLHKGGIQDIEE